MALLSLARRRRFSLGDVALVLASPGGPLDMDAEDTQQLTASAYNGFGTAILLHGLKVSWRSTDTDVATVSSSGLVTAIAEGGCDIIATVDGIDSVPVAIDVEGGGVASEDVAPWPFNAGIHTRRKTDNFQYANQAALDAAWITGPGVNGTTTLVDEDRFPELGLGTKSVKFSLTDVGCIDAPGATDSRALLESSVSAIATPPKEHIFGWHRHFETGWLFANTAGENGEYTCGRQAGAKELVGWRFQTLNTWKDTFGQGTGIIPNPNVYPYDGSTVWMDVIEAPGNEQRIPQNANLATHRPQAIVGMNILIIRRVKLQSANGVGDGINQCWIQRLGVDSTPQLVLNYRGNDATRPESGVVFTGYDGDVNKIFQIGGTVNGGVPLDSASHVGPGYDHYYVTGS